MRNFLLRLLALSIGLLTLALFAGIAFYSDPTLFIEICATHAVGHPVTIGKVQIEFQPLVIHLDDIHVANPTWGSQPDMLHIGHVTAEPDLMSLLAGDIKFYRLSVDSAELLLERNDKGIGNWKKEGAKPSKPLAPKEEAARSRTGFPTIFDLQVRNSRIVMHTSGGETLKIDFKDVHLQTADEKQSVMLNADGAYNGIAVHMDIKTESYESLHDTHRPFAMEITAQGATASVSGKLQMMDPLNFDELHGPLSIRVKNTGNALAFLGEKYPWPVALTLESGFEHNGDRWELTDVKGSLAGNPYKDSHILLDEGKRKEPDKLTTTLNFQRIAVDTLLETLGRPSSKGASLDINDNPPLLLDAFLTAQKLSYGKMQASNLALHANIDRGSESLSPVSMEVAGSKLQASLIAKTEKQHTHLTVKAELPNADVPTLLKALKIDTPILTGHITANLSITAKGSNTQKWAQNAQGEFRVSLHHGRISRRLVRTASTDVRTLLGSDPTMIQLTCMIGITRFTNGIGTLSPFRVETTDGTLWGAGSINLPRQNLDLVFQTNPETTSGLAFDIPIHIMGKIGSPHIMPAAKSKMTVNFKQSQNEKCD